MAVESVLELVEEGAIQLPEFQGSWVWPDEKIVGLLSSIGRGVPLAPMILLGLKKRLLGSRCLHGAPAAPAAAAEYLVLDGQQRNTTISWTLGQEGPVDVKRGEQFEQRAYFFDVALACQLYKADSPVDMAILSVPVKDCRAMHEGRDLFVRENQYALCIVPAGCLIGQHSYDWKWRFQDHWQEADVAVARRLAMNTFYDLEGTVGACFRNRHLGYQVLSENLTPAVLSEIYRLTDMRGTRFGPEAAASSPISPR
jgi:hypothetical protein